MGHRLNNRQTQQFILKLISEGRIEEAKYIEGLRKPRVIVVDIYDEDPEEFVDVNKIHFGYEAKDFWGDDWNGKITVLIPEDDD